MNRVMMAIGGLLGITLVVLAIWLWQQAEELVMPWSSRRMGLWSIWSAAAACAAAGQLVMLKLVAQRLFPAGGRLLPWALGCVCIAALAGAIGFGVTAR